MTIENDEPRPLLPYDAATKDKHHVVLPLPFINGRIRRLYMSRLFRIRNKIKSALKIFGNTLYMCITFYWKS